MSTQTTMTMEQMQAMIADLAAQNEKLKRENTQTREADLTMKVSEKGAVCVYGLGRFPVTLYKQQWQKLLKASAAIESFIAKNESLLSVKDKSNGTVSVENSANNSAKGVVPENQGQTISPVVVGDEVPFTA